MAKILLIEDAPDTQILVNAVLEKEHDLTIVSAFSELAGLSDLTQYDLIILDINLPGKDGFEICQEIKSDTRLSHIPIIFISSRDGISDKSFAFDLGAEDYLSKPFDPRELAIRVKAKLGKKGDAGTIHFSSLTLNVDRQLAYENNSLLDLTRKEYALLVALVRHAGEKVSRERLMAIAWGGAIVEARTIDSHICRLRSKLTQFKIESAYGDGYCLVSCGDVQNAG